MQRTESVVLMNLCMVRGENDAVLVLNRRNKDWPGLTFPGGHVEPGESFTGAVLREVKEETGLTVCSVRLCGIKQWIKQGVRKIVLLYTARYAEGELASSKEGDVFWMPLKDLLASKNLAHNFAEDLCVFCSDEYGEVYFTPEENALRLF